jgi:hypothetical protein
MTGLGIGEGDPRIFHHSCGAQAVLPRQRSPRLVPRDEQVALQTPALGRELRNARRQTCRTAGLVWRERPSRYAGGAGSSGLQPGDLITTIGADPVRNVEQADEMLGRGSLWRPSRGHDPPQGQGQSPHLGAEVLKASASYAPQLRPRAPYERVAQAIGFSERHDLPSKKAPCATARD